MAQGFPERMGKEGRDAIDALYVAEKYGQKNGSGFYTYSVDKRGRPKKTFSEDILPILADVCQQPQDFDDQTIIQRVMIPMINEVGTLFRRRHHRDTARSGYGTGLRFRLPSI
eukprot:TRINITY_DN7439_c0_g1_i1.p1 TRINITY_DN7439_c0_g1~~TRINITY_DN7439_c0_g1_i1.p1  ORF type:complete len:113 (+),score=4.54 TRINITY_DN7439_c0_g1_i1:124-462(+)